ncbi:MAG: Hsp20/alpha crystallin family protein, partial [Halobacteriota archaeon]
DKMHEKKKMTPEEDWMCMALDQAQRALDMARGMLEDMYERLVPKEQRLSAEQMYKKFVAERMPERMPKPSPPVRRPDIDILDLGTEIHLIADLPGVKKDDIDIELMPGSVQIKAAVTAETEREQQPYKRRERGYMAYKRSLDLPEDVVPEKAKATFNNGVLKLVMPRKEPVQKPKPTMVPVKDTGQTT